MLLISLATMDDRLTVLKYAWHNESLGNTEHLRFTCSGMPKDARGDDVLWNKANFQEWNRGRAGMLEEHQLSLAVLCFHQLLLIESSTYYIFMRPQISDFSLFVFSSLLCSRSCIASKAMQNLPIYSVLTSLLRIPALLPPYDVLWPLDGFVCHWISWVMLQLAQMWWVCGSCTVNPLQQQ